MKPPLAYINSLDNREVICLLNTLTKYYSQTGKVYHAELYISNNTWESIKSNGVTLGRKRKDVLIDLSGLVEISVESGAIRFKYDTGDVVDFPVTDDFFYYMEWEDDYYD